MKTIIYLTLFIASSAFAQYRGVKVIGNGGSVVNQDLADIYYVRKASKLPPGLIELDLENDYPDLYTEVNYIYGFITSRNKHIIKKDFFPLLLDLKNIKVFSAQNLSGKDPIPVGNKKSHTVSYTYFYEEMSENYNEIKSFHVVELLQSRFFQLSVRTQALLIIHELMHINFPKKDHKFISPFIKNLHIVLRAYDRQNSRDYSNISKLEYEASVKLKNLTLLLFGISPDSWTVSKAGGGLAEVTEQTPSPYGEEMYIGMSSLVRLSINVHNTQDLLRDREPDEIQLYLDKLQTPDWKRIIKGTKIIDSHVFFKIVAVAFQKYGVTYVKTCNDNLISNSDITYFCKSKGNSLINIKYKSLFRPSGYIDIIGNNNYIDTFEGNLDLQGSYNKFINVKSYESTLIDVNNNFFENVELSRTNIKSANDSEFKNSEFSLATLNSGLTQIRLSDIYLRKIELVNVSNNILELSGLRINGYVDLNMPSVQLNINSKNSILEFDNNKTYSRMIKQESMCILPGICDGKVGPDSINIKSVAQFEKEFSKKYRVTFKD